MHTSASILLAAALLAAPLVSAPARADAALAAKNGCAACHALDKKVVGPSWKDIAAKHKGEGTAALAAKVRAGGKGAWGNVAMPPQPRISDADLNNLLEWMLKQ